MTTTMRGYADNAVKQEHRKKILLIEDEEDVCKILAYRLRKIGFDVFIANDGEAGLKEVYDKIPDLVILDLMLPSLSGEEVCKAIREDERKEIQSIPVIMLTAKSRESDRIVGKVVGANQYMMKPFDIKKLIQEINHYIA